ncbi:diguanylate cyclase [Corticibacter populi]|uniref:Diguanylate cyclase n=1 Tax=Corticibacter populi TaxID=1550736 RepID=A0A3M6QYE8_9BURK|nr:diguanylate cyclase [Corticibacter populi]RMX08035.1 diguanylate cyclase [Corticibacter populi]RZS35280.1 diguanylate cyclase (GGDEF)-like protein [Corticibacter populi]
MNGLTKQQERAGHGIRLRDLLRSTQIRGIMLVVLATGFCLTLAALWTITRYANNNLELLGRTLAYNLEAPLVFNDAVAVQSILDTLATQEDLSYVRVQNADGTELGQSRNDTPVAVFMDHIANLLLEQPLHMQVTHAGEVVGALELRMQGRVLVQFLLAGGGLILLWLVLGVLMAACVSARLQQRISRPLDVLSEATRQITWSRNFAGRVPNSPILEFNELTKDINKLVAQVQQWHELVLHEKAELEHRADHDALTGLANRSRFEVAMQKALLHAMRQRGHFALLFLDCDGFKSINDSFGHAAGDQVLKKIAKRLQNSLRDDDQIIRLGGDEFAVVIGSIRSEQDVVRVAEKILVRMAAPIFLENAVLIDLTISIGIALYPQHGDNTQTLSKAADQAMYQAKRQRLGYALPEPGQAHMAAAGSVM